MSDNKKPRSLRGRGDRSEKVENRGQIFSILRRIVVLFNEKSGKYGPIIPLSQQISSAAQAPSAAERIFRSLLKLFPFDFRSNYGRELEQVFREQRREAREGKGLAPTRLWSRTIRGVFSTALSEHLAIFGRDARYGVRTLLQAPTFTMAVVVTLMVGIGANTAIFSVVNGVLLRSLPYDEPERLGPGLRDKRRHHRRRRLSHRAGLCGLSRFGNLRRPGQFLRLSGHRFRLERRR